MKITIVGTVKEVAALADEAQTRRQKAMFGNEDSERIFKGLGLLVDLKEKGLLKIEVLDKEKAVAPLGAQSSEEESGHSY